MSNLHDDSACQCDHAWHHHPSQLDPCVARAPKPHVALRRPLDFASSASAQLEVGWWLAASPVADDEIDPREPRNGLRRGLEPRAARRFDAR